jgi:hypothetical protein
VAGATVQQAAAAINGVLRTQAGGQHQQQLQDFKSSL